MRYILYPLLTVIGLTALAFLHYTMPRMDLVRIVGAETQRIDTAGSWFYANSENTSVDGTRDVKLIQSVNESGKPRVYRNEDTGWFWPPYFKFDSSNVQAQAAELISSRDAPRWVLVKKYGWRSEFLSIYPNVVSLREVDSPADKPWPIGNILKLLILGGIIAGIYRAITGFWDRRVDPVIDRVADVFDGDDDAKA